MNDLIIEAMRQKGWSIGLIANRTGIAENRLRDNRLGVRESRMLARIAEQEAGVLIDELWGDEE